MPEPREGDLMLPAASWPVDESAFTLPDETYANATPPAITTVVGEPGFHIDAQTRNALRQAFTAGKVKGKDEAAYEYAAFEETGEPDFDEWLDQYIEDHERITSE